MILPNWNAPKQVKAFSSTRHGGFSQGVYQGLNLGMHVGDDPVLVLRNRQSLVATSAMPSSPIWLNQTHSTVVLDVDAPTEQVLDADGLITSTPNVVCSAMTADCLPVLMTNRTGTQVAAVHVGWRGLVNGIVEHTAARMSGDVMVWLGPAIGAQAFEVGKMFSPLLLLTILKPNTLSLLVHNKEMAGGYEPISQTAFARTWD